MNIPCLHTQHMLHFAGKEHSLTEMNQCKLNLQCEAYMMYDTNGCHALEQIRVVSRMDGWIQITLEGQMSQQLLSFMSLLSSGTRCTSWWVESWMLLLCDRFKAGCCCPLGTCLASDSSLLGVILNHPGHNTDCWWLLLVTVSCNKNM